MDVARSEVSGYGMIVPGATLGSVAGLVEKPQASETPSLRASIGRYVLEPDIFDLLRNQRPGAGGEIQLADAIDQQARQGRVFAEVLNGQRYDCGSKFGYLKAIVDLAHEDYGFDFRRFVLNRTQQQSVE